MIKSRRMRWAGNVTRKRAKENTYMLLMGKPEGKRPLGRSRCRRVDNIKMDLGEIGWGRDIDWIGLAEDRDKWKAFVNVVMNLWDTYNAGKCSSGCTTGGLSSSAQLRRVS
jgi:hypothetical protein